MRINKKVGASSSRSGRRRVEREAEGGASGALVGALVGIAAGPPGAIAGAIMGGFAGALAGAAMDQESSANEQRTRELDDEIGVTSGDLGAPKFEPLPSTSFASSEEASSEVAPIETLPADGVNFSVRQLTFATVQGKFTRWRGSLVFDEQAPENSRLAIEIDAASIDTKEPRRDAHLRSADFFDVEKYPKLVFKSTMVERASAGFKVTGDLTMRGVTRPVTLDVEYADRAKHSPMGERVGFLARGSLNRKDWGVNWNQVLDAGGLALGDEIEIHLGIEATKASRNARHAPREGSGRHAVHDDGSGR
jgi:polyisoprenoid-binding protein YceI